MTDPADALRDLANAMDGGPTDSQEPDPPAPATHRPESPINPNPPAGSHRPESPIAQAGRVPVQDNGDDSDGSVVSASALAELSGTTSAAYDPGQASLSRRKRLSKPDVGMMQFRVASVPVLITVGLMMGVLGLWGILVMAGNTSLPMADRPDAGSYGILALVGLPLALCMFAGAGFFVYQISIDKKKLKAYEEAKQAQRRG